MDAFFDLIERKFFFQTFASRSPLPYDDRCRNRTDPLFCPNPDSFCSSGFYELYRRYEYTACNDHCRSIRRPVRLKENFNQNPDLLDKLYKINPYSACTDLYIYHLTARSSGCLHNLNRSSMPVRHYFDHDGNSI